MKGSQGRNLEAGTEVEAMRIHAYGLVIHGLLSLLFYSTQEYQPRVGITFSDLGPPTSIINYEDAPHAFLTGSPPPTKC